MRPGALAGSRAAMIALWATARLASGISWRVARRPLSRLWFTPQRPRSSPSAFARQQKWLARASEMRLTAGGMTLSGFSAGAGPTVLLVHGWSDRAASLGAFVEPLVQRGFRVVGLDLPGHGDSPGGRTNAFEMAATLRDIDRELGGVDAVVAHSIGAFAAVLELANGWEPRAACLISPLVRVDHAVDRFAQRLRLGQRAVKALRSDLERKFGTDVWDKLSADLSAVRLEIPALIVHDQGDPETSWSDSTLLAQAWPGARMVTTRGLGHYRIVRDPDVAVRIADFISQRDPDAAAILSTHGGGRGPA